MLKLCGHNAGSKENQTTQWSKEKVQKNKQRSTKHTHTTKDRVTRTPLQTGGKFRCSGRVSSSYSTSGTRRVNLVTNPGFCFFSIILPSLFNWCCLLYLDLDDLRQTTSSKLFNSLVFCEKIGLGLFCFTPLQHGKLFGGIWMTNGKLFGGIWMTNGKLFWIP
jgi:hypothetical protein